MTTLDDPTEDRATVDDATGARETARDLGGRRAAVREPSAPRSPIARAWRRLPVRARVLASVLAMSLLGVSVTGAVSFVAQDRLVAASIQEALEQEVAEFRALAREGRDPETGLAFTRVERLLRVVMQRNVPDRNETYLSFLDGQPLEVDGGDRPIRLEEEPAVLAAVAQVGRGPDVVLRDVQTSAGLARMAIVPVRMAEGEEWGSYVIAFAVDRQRAELIRLARIYIGASAVSLLLVGLVGWLVAGRLLRPLRSLRESTQRITGSDLSERIPVSGNDDLADLTRTYNAMLDRLEDAIEMQRRFLDDAGHELRTPLTILRGNLELLDPGDADEVADTRALLLDEIDRMSRMVEDLILLSKARRPDFLVTDVVDVGRLLDDVMDKVRTLGSREWRMEERPAGLMIADPQRITQALVELAHNAVKFSAPGSPIGIGAHVGDDEVRVWVRDAGAGIPAAEVAHVFDRFRRVSSGRGVDGSGLGLSIVAAIAAAHGGRVEVSSEPGVGSVFTLVLPRTATAGATQAEGVGP